MPEGLQAILKIASFLAVFRMVIQIAFEQIQFKLAIILTNKDNLNKQ